MTNNEGQGLHEKLTELEQRITEIEVGRKHISLGKWRICAKGEVLQACYVPTGETIQLSATEHYQQLEVENNG